MKLNEFSLGLEIGVHNRNKVGKLKSSIHLNYSNFEGKCISVVHDFSFDVENIEIISLDLSFECDKSFLKVVGLSLSTIFWEMKIHSSINRYKHIDLLFLESISLIGFKKLKLAKRLSNFLNLHSYFSEISAHGVDFFQMEGLTKLNFSIDLQGAKTFFISGVLAEGLEKKIVLGGQTIKIWDYFDFIDREVSDTHNKLSKFRDDMETSSVVSVPHFDFDLVFFEFLNNKTFPKISYLRTKFLVATDCEVPSNPNAKVLKAAMVVNLKSSKDYLLFWNLQENVLFYTLTVFRFHFFLWKFFPRRTFVRPSRSNFNFVNSLLAYENALISEKNYKSAAKAASARQWYELFFTKQGAFQKFFSLFNGVTSSYQTSVGIASFWIIITFCAYDFYIFPGLQQDKMMVLESIEAKVATHSTFEAIASLVKHSSPNEPKGIAILISIWISTLVFMAKHAYNRISNYKW